MAVEVMEVIGGLERLDPVFFFSLLVGWYR